MKRLLPALLLLLASPAYADSAAAVNSQNNSGTVVQNPSGGSQTNINQNNAYSSTYGFGPGISCPTPSVAISAFGAGADANYGGGSSTYGASVSYIAPIGGDIGDSCRELAEEITQQRQLDTAVNLVRACADLARQGIEVDPEVFPDLASCSGVSIN